MELTEETIVILTEKRRIVAQINDIAKKLRKEIERIELANGIPIFKMHLNKFLDKDNIVSASYVVTSTKNEKI